MELFKGSLYTASQGDKGYISLSKDIPIFRNVGAWLFQLLVIEIKDGHKIPHLGLLSLAPINHKGKYGKLERHRGAI